MASYNPVGTRKNADQPINVTLIDYLDQNPHAMFEGASGAPKLQTAAIQDNAVTNAKLERAYYAGQVSEDGTTSDLPTGWSVSKTLEGRYDITHNLGTTAYTVVAMSESSRICSYSDKLSNSVRIATVTSSGNLSDGEINFIIVVH